MFRFADNPIKDWEERVETLGHELAALDEWRARATGRLLSEHLDNETLEVWAREVDNEVVNLREMFTALYLLDAVTVLDREA